MRKEKIVKQFVAVVVFVLFMLSANLCLAQNFVSIAPEKSKVYEFYLDGVFDYSDHGPAHYFVVSPVADFNGEPAGDLTITLAAKPDKEFTARMIYSMTGAGMSLDEGFSYIFAAGAAPGSDISTTVSVNSVFGSYFLAVKIDMIAGDVETPVPFTIKFEVSGVEESEE